MPTFTSPCTIAAPRCSYCRWSSWSCPQYNRLWLQTQKIMHFKPSQFHHFHFSTHSGEKPVFSSFWSLWSQKAFGLSHRGETTPALIPTCWEAMYYFWYFVFVMQVQLNHIGKYLESKESERDEATSKFFEIKKSKKEFEMRESSRKCRENTGEKLIPRFDKS